MRRQMSRNYDGLMTHDDGRARWASGFGNSSCAKWVVLALLAILGTVAAPAHAAAPANDNVANAQLISGTTGTVTGNNTDATEESGEPNHSGSTAPGGNQGIYSV